MVKVIRNNDTIEFENDFNAFIEPANIIVENIVYKVENNNMYAFIEYFTE